MTGQRRSTAASACGGVVLVVLMTVLAAGIHSRVPHGRSTSGEKEWALAPSPDARAALPVGFSAAVDLATSTRFVRVVAGDIDRDGDLDVVASVGTLDLIVWKNDGAGHFSRVPSSKHHALQAQPSAPSLDGDGLASEQWVQNDHHRGVPHVRRDARTGPGLESSLSASARAVIGRYGPRLRSSRAPPLVPAV